MKKIGLILMSMLITAIVFQSCQDDITDLSDPRDGIAKRWEITEEGGRSGYWVTVEKDPVDKTKIIFRNFHDISHNDLLYATFDGENIIIQSQTLDEGTSEGPYTFEGDGYVSKTGDAMRIEYDFTWGDDNPVNVIAYFGEVFVTKKKKVVASLSN